MLKYFAAICILLVQIITAQPVYVEYTWTIDQAQARNNIWQEWYKYYDNHPELNSGMLINTVGFSDVTDGMKQVAVFTDFATVDLYLDVTISNEILLNATKLLASNAAGTIYYNASIADYELEKLSVVWANLDPQEIPVD